MNAIKFMTEQGALYNISQVFNFVQRRSTKPQLEIDVWTVTEIQVLILCFDLFSFAKTDEQVSFGLTGLIFSMVYEAMRQLSYLNNSWSAASIQQQIQPCD